MNEVRNAPQVPVIDDDWISERRGHLMSELAPATSRRRARRLVLSGGGAGIITVAAFSVGVFGLGASPAFAGWSADPTTSGASSLAAAEAACSQQEASIATQNPMFGPAGNADLTDSRGPYTLVVYGEITDPSICVSGNGFTAFNESSSTTGASPAPGSLTHYGITSSSGADQGSQSASSRVLSPTPAPAGQADVDQYFSMFGNDAPFTAVEGEVGAGVSSVNLVLSDGSQVQASIGDGMFVAWWPGSATVTTTQVSSAATAN